MWRFLDKHFEEILGSILLAVMVTVTFINVIVRYCTSFSFAWSEELTIYFFCWVVFLGAARSFREGSNLCMTLLYESCSKPVRLVLFLVSVVLCITFFGAIAWMGTLEVLDEIEVEVTSESLGIPVACYTIATPVLSLLTIFRILQRTVTNLREGKY